MLLWQDWASYQAERPDVSGLHGVFVKCTEGLNYVNPRYSTQIEWLRACKKRVGHYVFLDAHVNDDDQVHTFEAHIELQAGDVIAVDWESAGETQADRDRAIKDLKAKYPLHRVGTYCDKDFWFHLDTESYCGDFLWIAAPDDPAGRPAIAHPWVWHQYSEAGGTDHDVANFADDDEYWHWASGITKTGKGHVVHQLLGAIHKKNKPVKPAIPHATASHPPASEPKPALAAIRDQSTRATKVEPEPAQAPAPVPTAPTVQPKPYVAPAPELTPEQRSWWAPILAWADRWLLFGADE